MDADTLTGAARPEAAVHPRTALDRLESDP
jgi:hypothetical protein